MADNTPDGLDEFLATPTTVAAAVPATDTAAGEPAGLNAFIAPELKEAKYGTTEQMVKTGLEGAAQGLLGPLAPALEIGSGLASPEDIRGREETNPNVHLASELAGFAGPAVVSGGATLAGKTGLAGAAKAAEAFTQAGVLGKAGEAIGAATGLGKAGSGFIEQVSADAIKSAFEGGLYQGGAELAAKFKEDPEQTAGSAMSHIGLAGVMGGVFGGALGAALRKTGMIADELPAKFVSEVDAPKLANGDFKTIIEHSDDFKPAEKESIFKGLAARKKNADEIENIAHDRGYPVLEGMISKHEMVQRAEDGLIHGGNTPAALRRQQLYKEAYEMPVRDVEGALGEASKLSKAQIGEDFQQTLVSQIKEENEPIKAMYDNLKMHNEFIPLHTEAGRIITELEHMPEFRLTGSLPGGNLVKGAIEGIGKAQTVDDLKMIRSALNGSLGPTAAPAERRVAAIVGDKLKQLEEDSIEAFAKASAKTPEEMATALGLNAARKEADATYKPFIQKLQKLSKALGKENIGGTQGAIQFIQNLTPEQVTSRLFNKNNSQFLKFFDKEFPEQAAQMRAYQKGVLRDAATKEGVLSPRDLFNRINKLEPEIQESIFTKAELATINDAETYLRSFPKNFNPSGTAHTSNMLDSFSKGGAGALLMTGHPVAAAGAYLTPRLRDAAMEKFIQSAGASPRGREAIELAKATIAGERMADKGISAVVHGGKELPQGLSPTEAERSKLSKLVDTYKADPSKMLTTGDNNPIPEYAQAFSAAAARAVEYLSSIKPDTQPKSPLDSKREPSSAEKATYNRALDIAQQPLNVLLRMKAGTLTPQDVITLKTIYPSVYQGLSQKIMNSIIKSSAKSADHSPIPYKNRLQFSLFLGQPLDSTMTQSSIAAAQPKLPGAQNQESALARPAAPNRGDTKSLGKLPSQMQTADQHRASRRSGSRD